MSIEADCPLRSHYILHPGIKAGAENGKWKMEPVEAFTVHTFTNVVVCTVCVLLEMVFIILNILGIRTRQNDLIKAYILFSCIANTSCIVAVFINYVNYIYLHQHLLSKSFYDDDKIFGVSGTVAIAFSYCVGDTGLAILLHRIRAIE